MRLHLVTKPVVEPVTLDEVTNHRKVDSTADDDLLLGMIEAARQTFEQETGRQVMTATWRGTLDRFPCAGPIRIPRPPLLSVVSITYIDTAGASQTWSSSAYVVQTLAGPFARHGMVSLAHNETYPDTGAVENAVTVNFTAGYGATLDLVPQSVKTTILELIGDMYEHREEVITGTMVVPNPSLQRLLNRHRLPVYA